MTPRTEFEAVAVDLAVAELHAALVGPMCEETTEPGTRLARLGTDGGKGARK